MKKICISKKWTFASPDYPENMIVDLPHDYIVKLPRTPDAKGTGHNGYFDGTCAKYSKLIKPEEAAHTILNVDGAYMCARFYCNNQLLDMHPHGYTPYLVDLTDVIVPGINNKIEIDVINVQPSTRWYSGSGVYRDVCLWTGGRVRIEPWDMFIHTQSIDNGADVKVKMDISADMACCAEITVSAIDNEWAEAARVSFAQEVSEGKNSKELLLHIDNPKLWDCDNPNLYKLNVEIKVDGNTEDVAEESFGIRTVTADSKNGLLLNGKSIKLQGGCIHHDNGILGSAELPMAVERKLGKLKSVGYNAIRSAHNPPSLALLEIADRMGILVMDEAFDMWNRCKTIMDYSLWFKDWWDRDISYMVMRDRNHPCVISYSIGNEIPETSGNSKGFEWAKRLSDEIRKYDNTRFVTSGICGIGDPRKNGDPEDYNELIRDGYDYEKRWSNGESWVKRTEKYMENLDIVGYNYLYFRYDEDSKRYPDRVIWGSETYALTFYESWSEVMSHTNVIGDFTWTAYDNLGEVGTGRWEWGKDGYVQGIDIAEYPWRSCYQGDFDLCGYRRPQSYFREAIWKNTTAPHIFTTHPCHNGDVFSGTEWHWYDVNETWTFADEYIGETVKTEVYTTADEVVFYLNGTEVARAVPEKAIATAYIPYEKGELTAVAVRDGKEESKFSLKTTGEAYKLVVKTDISEIVANNRDLCYFEISVVDKEGNVIADAKNEITCQMFGGELVGIYSGCPNNEDDYGSNKCHLHHGRALAVARCAPYSTDRLVIRVSGEGLTGGVSDMIEVLPER